MAGSRVRKFARACAFACGVSRKRKTRTVEKHSNNNSQQRQRVILLCVGPPLVDHATVLRMAIIRILIKLWQVSEYGNVACAFVCACSFSRTRVNKHMRHPSPTHAPHEKQEARTRMGLTEKRDTARRSQKSTRDRCHCGFAFRAF